MDLVYAYYPGCTLHSTAREYDVSTQAVCKALGIGLRELDNWTCCGASSAHSSSRLLDLALSARNLQLAEEKGLPLAVPCAMCFSRFKFASHELKDSSTLATVNRIISKEFGNTVAIEPLLKILSDDTLPIPVKRPLEGLRVACYYGCLLVRPGKITDFDDEENPQTMDSLMERLGAEPISWDFKTECCGASMTLARPDIVLRLSHRILSQAKRLGADCVAVACPMCHSNLDMRQREIEAKYKEKIGLPVLYFTQLMGLALDIPPRELMLHRHFTEVLPVLRGKGLA